MYMYISDQSSTSLHWTPLELANRLGTCVAVHGSLSETSVEQTSSHYTVLH